jgi:hypothetical protein
MRTLIAAIVLVVLTGPASALCLPGLDTEDSSDESTAYPSGEEDLTLCQQDELSVIVDKKANAERLRLLRSNLLSLDLSKNQIQLTPIAPLPPASLLDSPDF